ncbi:MAG TPA: type IV pilin protein [Burkholderiaceae bacterium]|nr:type IV pilin protein [Burkholderiaceae bacterium]
MMLDRHRGLGFTLIEVMIVVAVVAILSAVAYPSYVSHIAKGKRAECRGGLMQSLQQQERHFTQYNAYATFTEASTTARTKAFSGETLATSACRLQAVACTAPSNTDTARCIELRAAPVRADSGITYLYVDSEGNKGCDVGGSRTSTNKTCWP